MKLIAFCFLASIAFFSTSVSCQEPEPELIRGVNLGGWLVLEPWITPSLFDQFGLSSTAPIDQYTFCQHLGPVEAKRQLEKHWDTWVTLDDMITLAKYGITHVRIPVGFWMFDIEPNEPWVNGDLKYLLRGLEWARQAKLRVLIDLHGVPGSQNGFDNSGIRGDIHWPDAASSGAQSNYERTLKIYRNLTQTIDMKVWGDVVMGFQLVNEPFVTVDLKFVQQYYYDGYGIVRQNTGNESAVMLHDSFRLNQWENFMRPPQFQKVYMDTHIYHVFDNGLLGMNKSQHLGFVCGVSKPAVAASNSNLWTVVGEFCLATNDCAKWLNGYNTGSRWEGTFPAGGGKAFGTCTGDEGNDIAHWSNEYKAFLRQFAETQFDAYETAGVGWFFWNFKSEQASQWNYMQLAANGIIPVPPSNRSHHC